MSRKAVIYYGGFLRNVGGAFQHARTIERELRRQGWKVECITLDDLPVWCRYIPHAVERFINYLHAPFGFIYKGYITKVLYKYYFGYKVDLRIFEDIYITWDSPVPSVSVLHAVWSDNIQAYSINDKKKKSFCNREAQIINRISQPVITVSFPYQRYIVEEHFSGKLVKNIDVINLGIEPSINTHSHDADRIKKSIIYCGALEARKNPLFLLEVFKKLYEADPEYTLTVIGDGPYREQLIAFAKRYSLPAVFLGRLDYNNVMSKLLDHELYIHTSVKESFSYSLLEAKIAGLTTCAYSKLQVPREFIDVGFEVFCADEWCRKILEITPAHNDFDGRKYSAERMTRSTLELLSLV
jgi:glycosyltransferase involved in cell wall biosynthesis